MPWPARRTGAGAAVIGVICHLPYRRGGLERRPESALCGSDGMVPASAPESRASMRTIRWRAARSASTRRNPSAPGTSGTRLDVPGAPSFPAGNATEWP